MSEQRIGVSQFSVAAVLKVHHYYMLLVNALLQKVVAEQCKQQIRLSATAHTRHNLYHAIAFSGYDSIKMNVTFYFHAFAIFVICHSFDEYKGMYKDRKCQILFAVFVICHTFGELEAAPSSPESAW